MPDHSLLLDTPPPDWKQESFGELCMRIQDAASPSANGERLYLGLEHLASGFPALVGRGTESEVRSAKTAFRKGDVLFGKLRPYLRKSQLVDEDGICSTDILVLRANDKCLPGFLCLVTHTDEFISHAMATTSGVQHPRTSWAALKEFNLYVPPLAEQSKITAVLDVVRKAIHQQERLFATTTELTQALRRRLFTRGLQNETLKETEIGSMPDSWSASPIGTCCEVLSGSLSYTDFLKLPDSNEPDTVSCMAVKVSDMNLPGNNVSFVKANELKRLPVSIAIKKLIPPNVVVFPKRGAAIATNKKRLTTIWTVLDPNLIGLAPKDGLDPRFLFHWSQTFDLRRITDPGPTPQLNKKDLLPVKMPFPKDIEEQREIASLIDCLERKADIHDRKRATLADLFRNLLQQLMTAQIRVSDLDLPQLDAAVPS